MLKENEWGPFTVIADWVLLLPTPSVTFRRFHDVGRTLWWVLIIFTGIGIGFPCFYWWIKPGDAGPNRYGLDPTSPDYVWTWRQGGIFGQDVSSRVKNTRPAD